MALEGYASSTSVFPKDMIRFYLGRQASTELDPRTLTLVRYGDTVASASARKSVAYRQPPESQDPWQSGYGWSSSWDFTIPEDFSPGLYMLRDGDVDGSDVLSFVVKTALPSPDTRILLSICFNTPQAYNAAGGKSLYGFNSGGEGGRATKVSFDRPTPALAWNSINQWSGELKLIDWLRREGYGFDICSSIDLHNARNGALKLDRYDLLLIAGHAEYWSREMRDNVDQFVTRGGNLAVFSGNTCFRQVRFEDNDRVMVFYKQPDEDPLTNVDNSRVTVAFAHPPVSRPPNSTIGLGFDSGAGCYDGPGLDKDAVYTIRMPDHWVFEGIRDRTQLGAQGLGLLVSEVDAADCIDFAGSLCVTGNDGTPRNFAILAEADLRAAWWNRGKPGRAMLGTFVRNGTVFNAGAIGWSGALLTNDDVSTVTRNVVRELGTRRTWSEWERIGHAYGCTAMTSIAGKLYNTTSDGTLWARLPAGCNVSWRRIGFASDVKGLGATEGLLFNVTKNDAGAAIWWRPPIEAEMTWTRMSSDFSSVVPDSTGVFSADGGMLYAADAAGNLYAASAGSASSAGVSFHKLTLFTGAGDPSTTAPTPLLCMTADRGILYAVTANNRLVRSNLDIIHESTRWTDLVAAPPGCKGLAVIDDMIYAVTSSSSLHRMDLLHFKSATSAGA